MLRPIRFQCGSVNFMSFPHIRIYIYIYIYIYVCVCVCVYVCVCARIITADLSESNLSARTEREEILWATSVKMGR